MKKLFMVLLAMVATLTLSACGDKDLDCEDNQLAIDGECVGLDNMEDLEPDQIADLLIDEFDGGLGHLGSAMQGMDFEDASEMTVEVALSMTEDGYPIMDGSMMMVQKTAMVDGYRAFYQKQEVTFEGMSMMQETIMVEVETGVDIYFNVGGFVDGLDAMQSGEISDYLAVFNLDHDWVMIHFEDSLENMIELNVAKDFFLDILEAEIGPNPFNTLHDELELELDIDLDMYNVNLVTLGNLLEASDYEGIKTYLENVDFEGLQDALMSDMPVESPIPGVDPVAYQEALMNMDHAAFLVELETFDFEEMLTKVSEGETVFEGYVAGLTEYPEMKALLEPMTGFVGMLEEEGVLEEVAYIAESLSDFEDFFTYQYYIDQEFLNVTAEIVNEDNVLTTATVDPTNFSPVFEDFVTKLYWFLYEFPGNTDVGYVDVLNCPAGANCEEFTVFDDVADAVENLEPLTAEFLFDPSGDKSMEITIDAKNLLQSIADEESRNVVNVIDAEVSMSMSEAAEIVIPTNAVDIKDAMEEVVKLAFIEDVVRGINNVYNDSYYFNVNPGLYTLETYPNSWALNNPALDEELSTILVTEDDIIFTLYWRDGTMVLDQPVDGSDMEMLLEENMYAPDFTRTNLMNMINLINDTNYSTGKAAVYMLMD